MPGAEQHSFEQQLKQGILNKAAKAGGIGAVNEVLEEAHVTKKMMAEIRKSETFLAKNKRELDYDLKLKMNLLESKFGSQTRPSPLQGLIGPTWGLNSAAAGMGA